MKCPAILFFYLSIILPATVDGMPSDPDTLKKKEVLVQLKENMTLVQGGTFTMGCTENQGRDCPNDAHRHEVTVSSFYMGKFEVTQAQWLAVMGGRNPSHFPDDLQCPVENISWSLIQEFITRLNKKTGENYRLPTEAEWEFAARGGNLSQGNDYAGSDDLDAVAWHKANSGGKTHPVGCLGPNEMGLFDMSGNVQEWCSDLYAEGYYKKSPAKNPAGPAQGSYHVVRGGAWDGSADECRVWVRSMKLTYYNYLAGFRLVRDAE